MWIIRSVGQLPELNVILSTQCNNSWANPILTQWHVFQICLFWNFFPLFPQVFFVPFTAHSAFCPPAARPSRPPSLSLSASKREIDEKRKEKKAHVITRNKLAYILLLKTEVIVNKNATHRITTLRNHYPLESWKTAQGKNELLSAFCAIT